jgi:hypothetical protein
MICISKGPDRELREISRKYPYILFVVVPIYRDLLVGTVCKRSKRKISASTPGRIISRTLRADLLPFYKCAFPSRILSTPQLRERPPSVLMRLQSQLTARLCRLAVMHRLAPTIRLDRLDVSGYNPSSPHTSGCLCHLSMTHQMAIPNASGCRPSESPSANLRLPATHHLASTIRLDASYCSPSQPPLLLILPFFRHGLCNYTSSAA